MPKEARELASFMALVVDATTKKIPALLSSTEIRCFKKCTGIINSELESINDPIQWKCSNCNNEGTISDWQGTKWDNR